MEFIFECLFQISVSVKCVVWGGVRIGGLGEGGVHKERSE